MTIPTPRQWEDWSGLSFNAHCKCWLICSIHCLFRSPLRLLYTSLFYLLSALLTTETIVYQFILFTVCFAYHWDYCIPVYSIHCLFHLPLRLLYTSITRKPSSSLPFFKVREKLIDRGALPNRWSGFSLLCQMWHVASVPFWENKFCQCRVVHQHIPKSALKTHVFSSGLWMPCPCVCHCFGVCVRVWVCVCVCARACMHACVCVSWKWRERCLML